MAYSEDYRRRVIEYRKEGHTFKETMQVFKVALITIQKWEKKLKEEETCKLTMLKIIYAANKFYFFLISRAVISKSC